MYDDKTVRRFLSKVRFSIFKDGCWEWTACRQSRNGYGRFSVGRRTRFAHRVAWEIENGVPVPVGMDVCHRCDNARCVNPDHLFVASHKDNMHDMIQKGRHNWVKEAVI